MGAKKSVDYNLLLERQLKDGKTKATYLMKTSCLMVKIDQDWMMILMKVVLYWMTSMVCLPQSTTRVQM